MILIELRNGTVNAHNLYNVYDFNGIWNTVTNMNESFRCKIPWIYV